MNIPSELDSLALETVNNKGTIIIIAFKQFYSAIHSPSTTTFYMTFALYVFFAFVFRS